MATSKDKKETQHVLVCTRVRPFNTMELECGAKNCIELHGRDVIVKVLHGTKKYTYDRVFGMDSKQEEVYNTVLSPMIEEIMQGYNCTVFAYGQTGTGKTYTMVGSETVPSQDNIKDPHLGIIPRTLDNLFTALSGNADVDFTVRVSYLELYNEILIDLLSDEDKVLKIFEDQKSKGAVRVHGLEEETVFTKKQVFEILKKGSDKRMTAGTLMNARSSRSHTVFTITLHSRELTPDGEELVKTGKLNLVDLAGSENITKSGAIEKRAREAGSINQSLLTLGRVIKALVDNSSHIPYRESKLTRILQDSLGGKTKTAIIATISPASTNLEETLSTLDYAFRARNITNRPEINQRMSKKALIQKYLEEIEHLKRDLTAARTQHGIYMNPENYESMVATEKRQKEELYKTVEQCSMFASRYKEVTRMKEELEECCNVAKSELAHTNVELEKLKSLTKMHRRERRIHQKLIDIYDEAQTALHEYSKRLSEHLDLAVRDQRLLVTKVQNLYTIMEGNEKFTDDFATTYVQKHRVVEQYFAEAMKNINNYSDEMIEKISNNAAISRNVISSFEASLDHFKCLTEKLGMNIQTTMDKITGKCLKQMDKTNSGMDEVLNTHGLSLQVLSNTMNGELANINNMIEIYQKKLEDDKMTVRKQFDQLKSEINHQLRSNNKHLEKLCTNVKTIIEVMEPSAKKVNASTDTLSKTYRGFNEDICRSLDDMSLLFKGKIDALKDQIQKTHQPSMHTLFNEQRDAVFEYQNGMTEFTSRMLRKLTNLKQEVIINGDSLYTNVSEMKQHAIEGDKCHDKLAEDISHQLNIVLPVIDALKVRGIDMVSSIEELKDRNNDLMIDVVKDNEDIRKQANEAAAKEDANVTVWSNVVIGSKSSLDDSHKAVRTLALEKETYVKNYNEEHCIQMTDLNETVLEYVGNMVFAKRQGDTPKAKQTLSLSATPKKVSKSLLAQLYEEEPDSETDTTDSI